ncbi:MAG: ATP-binding protein, partial [Pseudomonadota bacterium]
AASSTGRDKPIRLVPPDARWQVEMRGRPPLSLGMPMRSPFDDQWVVPLWVPVGSAAGQAMGWIRVEIRSSYMERFIERLPGFHMGSLVIMTTDGFGVIRVPHDESVVGVMRPGVVEFLRLAQGESGTVEFAPRTDNRLRLYSWKRLPAFPIAVAVGFEKSLVLAEWRRRTGQRALVSIVFSAAIAALTFGLMVYARRARSARERTEHLLRNLNSELESKIAERTAALKLANEDLEAFTYSVAHDLRGPIARLAAFVDLLERDLAVHTEPVGRRLAALRRQAREMNALVDDLLAFARAGSQAMSADRVDMDQLASQVRDEIEPATAGRSIEWFVDPLPGVHGDSALLREVWRNLIGNAVKYTAGRDPARIAIGTFKASATEIGFFIKDNGAGFDETYADQLFAPFRRLHSVSEFEGTGVGLAIVHRILRRHGGRIWGRGTPGAGASFCFTLRL